MSGSTARIGRAVDNLLDNALKWSPDGGVVEVACSGGTLIVRDHGPGVDDSDAPFIFDRFYRAPEARSKPGSGLGLAIVAQVARDEGGQRQRVPGRGRRGRVPVQPARGAAPARGRGRRPTAESDCTPTWPVPPTAADMAQNLLVG